AAAGDELVGADPAGFLRVPGQLAAPRPRVLGPHAVEPVVPAGEVAPRPAQDGNAQRPSRLEDIAPEALAVAQRRALIIDATVDAASEVLDELAEDAPVDRAELAREIDADAGHDAAE